MYKFYVSLSSMLQECVAKAKEEKNKIIAANVPPEQDEIPLFYSDIIPLLVRLVCDWTNHLITF